MERAIITLSADSPVEGPVANRGTIYASSRLAAGYAFDRPPVHRLIIKRVRERLRITTKLSRALDVGCGAGLSAAALDNLADMVVGLDPVHIMLAHTRAVAPGALFLVGMAERLPFSAGSFGLITAAGSVNYADMGLFLPEASRILTPNGILIIYDFSAGRRARGSHQLDEWFATFEGRYPPPPGYELDVTRLEYGRAGLRLDLYEELEVAVPMTFNSYLPYILSESGVESAISRGVPEAEIQAWCKSTLGGVFGATSCDVLFDAYVAVVSQSA